MKLIINGETENHNVQTLAELLAYAQYTESTIATAVNGEFVPKEDREDCHLSDGDQIEILAPMQGG